MNAVGKDGSVKIFNFLQVDLLSGELTGSLFQSKARLRQGLGWKMRSHQINQHRKMMTF
jgi:hypothetical protein